MKLRYLFAAALLAALPVTAVHAGVFISIAPPPLLVYDQPLCPTEGYLWTPGYWSYDYDAGQYYWVNGVWVPPPRIGFLWTPGYWGYNNGGYGFNEGYWGPTVGFYGGINYGYGYGGYGYGGGRWEGRNFRYNTAITHVNTSIIHNTYVDRNAVRNTTNSRTSFNGRGGITARPDAAQLAASRGTHVGPTGAQRNVLTQAKTTHASTVRTNTPTKNRTPGGTRNTTTNNVAHNNARVTSNNHPVTNTVHPNNRTQHVTNTTRNTGGSHPNLTRTRTQRVTHTPQVTHAPKVAPAPRNTAKASAPKKNH